MKVIKGNIWDYNKKGHCIVIPTNGTIKNNGEAVMGCGLALQAKERFEQLARNIGEDISYTGNYIFAYDYGKAILLTFPVKNNWRDNADILLIKTSAKQLVSWGETYKDHIFYLPKIGCGAGNLNWEDVEPILDKYLDDRFIVVDLK